MTTPGLLGFEALQSTWIWFLTLGISLVVLGTVALIATPAATIAVVLVLGWLMVLSGLVEVVHAFQVRAWGGFFLHLAGGVLGIVVGLVIVTHPLAGALASTLLFASFLSVVGLFRLLAAAKLKFPGWGWAAFDGAITLLLGIMVSLNWPWSGFWFLGLAVGISMLMRGWSYVMLAMAVKRIPGPMAVHRQAA